MSEVTPNTDEAVEFLRNYYGEHDAVLTAIVPDSSTTTRTFHPGLFNTTARRFIDQHQGINNLYFQVNPAKKKLSKKAKKSDIQSLYSLHVDLDPEPNRNIEQERERIRTLLTEYAPQPTIIIDSGGGYQGFWLLAEPMLLENENDIAEAERYNKELEHIFSADHCFNVDRIMRLPGTINMPTLKKRKHGRVEALARLIKFDDNLLYDLSNFSQAALSKTSQTRAHEADVNLNNLPDVNLSHLPIEDKYKRIIIHGKDPNDPCRYPSRSEAVFAVAIALIKASCGDEIILSILLNPDFKISESILEKPRPEKYAIRQIERARLRRSRRFHSTDLGNAKRLVFCFGDNLRYIPQFKKWLVWKNNRWELDKDGEIYRISKATILKIYEDISSDMREEIAKSIIEWGRMSENVSRIKAMVELAKTENLIPIQPEELDYDQWLMGLANGILNLRTFQIQPPEKENYITKFTDIKYDQNAGCPTWLKFLEKIMRGNENLIEFLQRAVGYSLTGSTKEQVLFFLYGTGANGKSVFQSTISALLGGYSLQVSAETFMVKKNHQISNDLARLRGARFIATSEVEDGQRMAESLVKQMTGQDTIVARFLYQENFEYIPNFKIWIAANHKPIIRGDDYAIWRRIMLIPFSVTIPKAEQDSDLNTKLKKELPRILNWALEGCKKWQEQGLNPPQEVLGATEEYREDMDIFGPWIKEHCVESRDAHGLSKQLYGDYKRWAEDRFGFSISQHKWGRKMTERGFKRENIPQTRYRGIGLRSKEEF